MLLQNAVRANKTQRKHCPTCHAETFHRMTNTRFWSIWHGMKDRTTNPNCPDYRRYGAVGRNLDPDWLDFRNFYRDMFPTYRDGLTIEREDNSLGYSKENCRWATNMEQQSNKVNNRTLTYQGREMHLAEFCRVAGVTRGAITGRLNSGMSPEEALQDLAASPYPKNRKSRIRTSTT